MAKGKAMRRLTDTLGRAVGKSKRKNQTSTIARPPGPAPSVAPPQPPEIKPRSHTVATDFSSSQGVSSTSPVLELTSSMEGSMETSHSSWGGSVEVDRQPSSREASEGSKPTPPPPPPQSTKPGRREPPQPKPKPSLANTPMRKKADKRPPVPQKPSNIPPVPQKPGNAPPVPQKPSNIPPVSQAPVSRSSPSSSPPLPRRLNEDNRTPSPLPPLPLPPALGQRKVDEAESNNQEYVMLENTSTMDPLESSSWFVGKMERVSAEQFLMEHGRQREFLVRERTARDGYYALSIRYHYSCKHFNIDPTPEGEYAIGNLTFPTISDIVHHYQNNSLFIHENQHVTLSVPARRRTRGTDMRIHS